MMFRASWAAAGALLLLCSLGSAAEQQCSGGEGTETFEYGHVFAAQRDETIRFADLPGFTRSVYARDHALITPESRVFAGIPKWTNTTTAHLISPATGAHFSMYLGRLGAGAAAPPPAAGVERFLFVMEGQVTVQRGKKAIELGADHFAYFPPNGTTGFAAASGANILVYERIYALKEGSPAFQHGAVQAQPLLPPGGLEVFRLRKLLPQTSDYDFNVHVMDFRPGEYLHIKEVHYNQHGLLLLQGQGIYRLGEHWYPVQAGDAIWMPAFVPQWYGALGPSSSRYILYKDTTLDPLLTYTL